MIMIKIVTLNSYDIYSSIQHINYCQNIAFLKRPSHSPSPKSKEH